MHVEQSVPANLQVEQSVLAAPQVGQSCLAVLLVVSTQHGAAEVFADTQLDEAFQNGTTEESRANGVPRVV